jgi:hypothetical protein
MKKLILTAALILVVGTTFGQTFQKGNLVGHHVMTINLDPDATMNQFKDFILNKFIPESEKNFSGMKVYLAKGIRGENENSFGLFYIADSVEDRDKYWNKDGTLNELGNSAWEKLQPMIEEGEKLGTFTSTYTDWVIQ